MQTYKIIGKDLNDKHIARAQPLADWLNNGGYESGIFETSERHMPRAEIQDFILTQFNVFNLPLPPMEIIDAGIDVAFSHLSMWDPYYMFDNDMTEIDRTQEWLNNTFKIAQDNGKFIELDSDDLETFVHVPDQDLNAFNYYMSIPGLRNLPNGAELEEHLKGNGYIEDVMATISEESTKWLAEHSPQMLPVREVECDVRIKRLIQNRKNFNHDHEDDESNEWETIPEWQEDVLSYGTYQLFLQNVTSVEILEPIPDAVREMYDTMILNDKAYEVRYDYFKLAMWASVLWFCGPLGRWFRRKYADYLFEICNNEGKVICHSGTFYSPKHYIVIPRPPKTCNTCGLDSFCVNASIVDGEHTQECEYHMNGHIAREFPITCGTRVCKYTECSFHPYHGLINAKQLMNKHSGQLTKMIQERQVRHMVDFSGKPVQLLM